VSSEFDCPRHGRDSARPSKASLQNLIRDLIRVNLWPVKTFKVAAADFDLALTLDSGQTFHRESGFATLDSPASAASLGWATVPGPNKIAQNKTKTPLQLWPERRFDEMVL
jgi:hypothetical protein